MDLTSKEARKILRDYYTWYWDNYYENSWKELRGNLSRFLGVDPSLNMHDAMNKAFGYDDAKPYHDKVDHTLDIRRGIEKGVLLEPCDRSHDDVMKDLSKAWKSLDIEDVVNGFLHSLSTGKINTERLLRVIFLHAACQSMKLSANMWTVLTVRKMPVPFAVSGLMKIISVTLKTRCPDTLFTILSGAP